MVQVLSGVQQRRWLLAILAGVLLSALWFGAGSALADGTPPLSASFSPSTVALGGSSTLDLNITAPASSAANGTVVLAHDGIGLEPGTQSACGGTLTVSDDSQEWSPYVYDGSSYLIELSGSSLTSSPCQISLPVTGAAAGTFGLQVNDSQGNNDLGNLTVSPATALPVVAASWSPSQIQEGQQADLAITVTNPNPGQTLTDLRVQALSNIPLGGPADSIVSNSCGGQTATTSTTHAGDVPAGVYVVQATLSPGASCQVVESTTGVNAEDGRYIVGVSADSRESGPTLTTTAPLTVTPTSSTVPPILTAAIPTISGTVRIGSRLTVQTSGWTAGALFTYQWFVAGKAVPGADASTFTLVGADYQKPIAVDVTGNLSGYSGVTKTSAATKSAAAGTLRSAVPKITGTARVGDKLAAKTGTWTKGTKFTYQWYADKRPLKGATKSTLKLGKTQKAKAITVKVTGRLVGYTPVAKISKATNMTLGHLGN